MIDFFVVDGRCSLTEPISDFEGHKVALMVNAPDKPYFNLDIHKRAIALGAMNYNLCPHYGESRERVESCNHLASSDWGDKTIPPECKEFGVNFWTWHTRPKSNGTHKKLIQPCTFRCDWHLPKLGGILNLILSSGYSRLIKEHVVIVGNDKSIAEKLGCRFVEVE